MVLLQILLLNSVLLYLWPTYSKSENDKNSLAEQVSIIYICSLLCMRGLNLHRNGVGGT